MRNKGVYRYDLNLRRGGRLKVVRVAQRLGSGFILERDETLVWDRGQMVQASLLPHEIGEHDICRSSVSSLWRK